VSIELDKKIIDAKDKPCLSEMREAASHKKTHLSGFPVES
jgi:hypothetical protein